MFRNVLIPLDGSDLSARVVNFLEPILRLDVSSIIALHVEGEPAAEKSAAHSDAVEGLRQFTSLRLMERQGDPTKEILAVAREEEASLIAMSTHGRTGLSRIVQGSVAERVLRAADVPVLLVNPFAKAQPEGSPIRRILVPLDGSATSAAVIPQVAQLAKVYGSHVTFFHVASPESHESPSGELREAAREKLFREQTAQYVDQLAEAGVRAAVQVQFEFGAASRILTAVENHAVDLVALTTHGRSGVSRLLFGSVAEHVVRQCRAPLLVKRIAGEPAA